MKKNKTWHIVIAVILVLTASAAAVSFFAPNVFKPVKEFFTGKDADEDKSTGNDSADSRSEIGDTALQDGTKPDSDGSTNNPGGAADGAASNSGSGENAVP
ncbi:MAG: hypothetical protein K6F16_02640, partial [Lachnospiraceae bacterium]|nr:hypothetical protein [Lachnospiraceae bacterium]